MGAAVCLLAGLGACPLLGRGGVLHREYRKHLGRQSVGHVLFNQPIEIAYYVIVVIGLLSILDITGVPIIDSGVAGSIRATTQARRLLDCDVALTGISAQVASTLAQLDVTFDDLRIARSPRDVLAAEARSLPT